LVFTAGAVIESAKLSSFQNSEIWGHLRAGQWILENRSWPQTGLFTQANNDVWRDFSWGYDVAAVGIYRVLGLRAIPTLLMLFRMALALVTFLLAGGRRGNFWGAVVLSLAAQFALSGMGPVPAFSSVILFGLELLLLIEYRNSGRPQLLYALPVLFVSWATLDIGFVYGIGLSVIFLAALSLQRVGQAFGWDCLGKSGAAIPLDKVAIAGGASLVASVLNPYGYHAFTTFWAIQVSPANRVLPGYKAMDFRGPQDYVVLLLTMAAFLCLGIRRSRDVFLFGVLVAGAMLSFPCQKRAWVMTLIAIAVIGATITREREEKAENRSPWLEQRTLVVAGLALAIAILAAALGLPQKREALFSKVAENFPARACESIRSQQLPQPLFNSYTWGSFLAWYMPEYPVAIDERRGLYSDEIEKDYFKVMNAEIPYQGFAPMKQSRTLLLDKVSPMGEALRDLPGFRVAYEDNLALVLVHEEKQ
jgi:hypothetical protein